MTSKYEYYDDSGNRKAEDPIQNAVKLVLG